MYGSRLDWVSWCWLLSSAWFIVIHRVSHVPSQMALRWIRHCGCQGYNKSSFYILTTCFLFAVAIFVYFGKHMYIISISIHVDGRTYINLWCTYVMLQDYITVSLFVLCPFIWHQNSRALNLYVYAIEFCKSSFSHTRQFLFNLDMWNAMARAQYSDSPSMPIYVNISYITIYMYIYIFNILVIIVFLVCSQIGCVEVRALYLYNNSD